MRYKAKPKAAGAKRESEQGVIPETSGTAKPGIGPSPRDECRESAGPGAMRKHATGKALNLNRACQGSKDKGLPRPSRGSSPDQNKIVSREREKVRQFQRTLWTTAKQNPERKFPKLFDRMTQSGVLSEAWRRVKANRGAAGVDGETLEAIEQRGIEPFIEEMRRDLISGRYKPLPVRRQYIPKPDGRKRPLGIPVIRDRVVQMAAKIVIEPIFEADFLECSWGFRPRRSATQALEELRKVVSKGYEWALEIDIEKYFDSIDQGKLVEFVKRRVTDRKILKLIRGWLRAGVMEQGAIRETLVGTPQGGVISPLLANIYLHELDRKWQKISHKAGQLVRYADDAVVVCKSESDAHEAHRRIEGEMTQLRLKLHPEKTRIVHLRRKGIDFLGCHLRMGCSRKYRCWYLYRWPSQRSMKRIRARIKEITCIQHTGRQKLEQVIEELNPVLKGWEEYFRTGNASQKFLQIDAYVRKRLVIFQNRRRHRNDPTWAREFDYAWYQKLNLIRLVGNIRYPGAVNAA